MTDTSTDKASRKERLWIDFLFLALFLVDWGLCTYMVFYIDEPITGEYGFAGFLGWAPITAFGLVPVLALYLLYQGRLLYRRFRLGEHPYQHGVRWATLAVFLLTFPVNYLTITILDGTFQSGG